MSSRGTCCPCFLVDGDGFGKLYSYNGMQYSLFWCLTGKEGIGRMTEYTLDPSETEQFLRTGSLEAGSFEECDDLTASCTGM